MRVLYYTTVSFLDQVLSFMPALSAACEVDLVVEVSPEVWNTNMLGDPVPPLRPGICDGPEVLASSLNDAVLASLSGLRSFHAAVHTCDHALHPRTALVSWNVRRFVAQTRPDVVHMNDVSLRLLMGGGPPGNVPLVLSIHDPFPHAGAVSAKSALARRLFVRRARRLILHNVSQRAAFCAGTGVSEDRVDCIALRPYNVYRSWQGTGGDAPGDTVLFLGRLAPYKGLDVFARAARLASESLNDVVFVVAGRPAPGCRVPATQELANGCKLRVLAKNLSNTELVTLVQDSGFVVLPYQDATQSGVVLTAYALGRPVVATRVGALPEYVSDGTTGLLVPPGDAALLAGALVGLVTEPQRLGHLRQGANHEGERGWGKEARETVNVYSQAAGS